MFHMPAGSSVSSDRGSLNTGVAAVDALFCLLNLKLARHRDALEFGPQTAALKCCPPIQSHQQHFHSRCSLHTLGTHVCFAYQARFSKCLEFHRRHFHDRRTIFDRFGCRQGPHATRATSSRTPHRSTYRELEIHTGGEMDSSAWRTSACSLSKGGLVVRALQKVAILDFVALSIKC